MPTPGIFTFDENTPRGSTGSVAAHATSKVPATAVKRYGGEQPPLEGKVQFLPDRTSRRLLPRSRTITPQTFNKGNVPGLGRAFACERNKPRRMDVALSLKL
jgi:hypothetical protein